MGLMGDLICYLGYPIAGLLYLITLGKYNLFENGQLGCFLVGIMTCVCVITALTGFIGYVVTGFLIDLIGK